MRWEASHEGDSGVGPGCGNGRDEAGGAACAAAVDKRCGRSGLCVGLRQHRAGLAFDLDRSTRARPNTVDPRARAGRSGYRPRLWHDGSVGRTAGVWPHGLVSRRHPRRVRGRRGTQSRAAARRRRLHGGREPADLGTDRVGGRGVAGGAATLPISGLTAWQGLVVHGRVLAGQRVIAHGAAGAVGSMVTQLARELGAYVIGTGRAADRQSALDFGAQEFVDLETDALEDIGGVDLVFDVIGGDIGKRSAPLIRAGGTLVSVVGPPEARPADGLAVDFVVESDRAQLSEIVQRVRDGRLRTNIGNVSTLDDAVAALNPTERRRGKTIIRVRP